MGPNATFAGFFFLSFFNESVCISVVVIKCWGECLEYKKGTAICYFKSNFPSLVHAG